MTSPSDLPLDAFMAGTVAEEGLTAQAGEPLEPGTPVASKQDLINVLLSVYDPEIPVNIYDLGLIYDMEIGDDGAVVITMTLTAPACPVAGEMPFQVATVVATVKGVGEVQVTLTWDPPWTQDRMTEDALLALGLG